MQELLLLSNAGLPGLPLCLCPLTAYLRARYGTLPMIHRVPTALKSGVSSAHLASSPYSTSLGQGRSWHHDLCIPKKYLLGQNNIAAPNPGPLTVPGQQLHLPFPQSSSGGRPGTAQAGGPKQGLCSEI